MYSEVKSVYLAKVHVFSCCFVFVYIDKRNVIHVILLLPRSLL